MAKDHNHNPNNVKVGDLVTDGENEHKLKVMSITPLQMYAKVKSVEDERFGPTWNVMTCRLRKIYKEDKKEDLIK